MRIPHKSAKRFSQLPLPIRLRSHQRERQELNLQIRCRMVCRLYKLGRGILNESVQVQETFYSYGCSYQILAVDTHAKSARDLVIMLRLLDCSNFATLEPL
ncbi:hypothetical protein H6G06_16545 [Anabaena sphaerica FACHB-251]|uniref:Uncharacterized protein n=1 Tax=Anabaena sphaerica FACHB-251 TaxID=2692883 RepID=A0A926WIG7_9NOST|nr:hypothetical protein [Anabaena sphaerica]MBD2295047.1 hypothetical protein [Anabaena sphaerica FACHB-251]